MLSVKESQLQMVSKLISIDDVKEPNARNYDAARKFITDKLCKDVFFKKLYCGTDLFGSYADNVKINKPDEYDCYLIMNFAKLFGPLKVTKSNIPSAALVNVGEWLNQNHNQPFSRKLKNLTDKDGYLLPDKMNSWFQSVIAQQDLSKRQSHTFGKDLFKFRYAGGFAQTFEITVGDNKFCIDLVLSIKLLCNQVWISDRKYVSYDGGNSYWNVAPKPHRSDERAFKTSFTKMETYIMNDKLQMKNVFRLVKKLFEKNQLHVKSYNIKTVFLWMDEERGSAFWAQSIYNVLIVVLEKFIEVFGTELLPCFWDQRENMIAGMNETRKQNITMSLGNEMKNLINGSNIPAIFFNKEEQQEHRQHF